VVEHVVASSVNDTALEHGVIESATANDFFGSPLGFVIGGTAIGPGTKKTDENYLAHTDATRRRNNIACAFNVNATEGLLADFTIDSGAMRHSVASRHGLRQRFDVVDTDW
jgi:hypothetical protein